jgi:nickel/cobalt transporter (NicO) family protein
MNLSLTMFAALSLGAVHALEPGHGKTFITSYLLTGRSSRFQLMIMGLSMALSHSMVLLALGALLFFFSSQVAEHVSHFILIGSPLLVAGIGAFMVYRVHQKKQHSGCSCKHHAQETHAQGGPIQGGPIQGGHLHGIQLQQKEAQQINTRTAAMVGFTGGLLPCPSALAVFSLSGTNGDPQSALCMMMLYIAGFILVMSALIAGASFIKNKLVAGYLTERKNRLIQKVSAYAILATGLLYLLHNLHEHI